MKEALKAFQSGIGDGNDLLPLAPTQPGSTETFDLDIRLRGRELVTRAGYPSAKFTGALTLTAIQNIEDHPYEPYQVEITAYPNFKVSYSVRGVGSDPTPHNFTWHIEIEYTDADTGESHTGSTTAFNASIINEGWVLAHSKTAEELLLDHSNGTVPSDVFTNPRYTVNRIEIHSSGGWETDAMLSVNGTTPAGTIIQKRNAKPYVKTIADFATRYDETRTGIGSVNALQGTIALKSISELGFPAPYPGHTVTYTLVNQSPGQQHVDLFFEGGLTQTTNRNAKVQARTTFKSVRTVSGQTRALQPARIQIELGGGSWSPAIPSDSVLEGPMRLLLVMADKSNNEYITAEWSMVEGNTSDYCSYNDDIYDEFGQDDGRRADDWITVSSSHLGYSTIGWTSNPRFFEGYINGDGPLLLRRGYRATISFLPPREETIDNEDYYVLDYSINSEDYYDYYGDFKIPINVDISSLTAKLSILSYDYDYEGPLDDQGIEIMFDSNRSVEWSWNKATGAEDVVLVRSDTAITMQSDRVWISSQITRHGYTIKHGTKERFELPEKKEFSIPDSVVGDLEYLVSCSNPNVNIQVIGSTVEASIVDPVKWPLRIHSGYYYLNQDEYYLYADKKVVTLRDVGYDSTKRYQMEIAANGVYTYDEVEPEQIKIGNFDDYLAASDVNLESYPGTIQLAVNNENAKQFTVESAPVNSLVLDESERILWVATDGSGVLGINIDTRNIVKQYSTTTEPGIPSDIVSAVDIDGDYIAIGLARHGIVVIDRRRNIVVAKYDQTTDPKLHWHNGVHIADLIFRNGLLYVASADGGGAAIIDVNSHTIRYFLGEYYQNYLTSIDYDSGRMAVGFDASGGGGGVIVWDVNNNDPQSAIYLTSQLKGPYQSVVDVKLEGSTVYAVQSRPNCIAVVNMHTGEARFINALTQARLKTVAVDDHYIYTGAEDGLYVFDKATHALVWKENKLISTGLGSIVNTVTSIKGNDRTFIYLATEAGVAVLCKKYKPYGRFISRPIDLTDDVVDIDPITWIGDEPPGTSIEVAIRTSSDGETWSNWSVKPPLGRYCQYQVELRSDSAYDYLNTPTLEKVQIGYSLATGRQKEVEIVTDPIPFMVRGDTQIYQLFQEPISEMLWDYIRRSTSYTPDNFSVISVEVRSLTEGVEVFTAGDIVYARTTEQIGLSDVDLILPDIPQQGAPILIRDERTKEYLRRVTFTDEWGRLTLVNQEELEVGENSTVFTSYTHLKDDVTAYDGDGNLLEVAGAIGNKLTIYRDGKPLKQREIVRVNYTLRDSFFVDFNYRENAVRFVFSDHYDELTLIYEGGHWSPFYEAENLNLNPLNNPFASGFVYLTNKQQEPHLIRLGASPSWVTSGSKEKANVYCVVLDKHGNPVMNRGVVFTASHGTLQFPDGNYTNNFGIVRAVYTPSNHVGSATITASALGTNLTANASIRLASKPKAQNFLTLSSETSVLVNTHAGDRQETLITAMVADERWYPIANQTVNFEIKSGGGTIEPVKTTNASGEAKAVYRAGAVSGITTIKASTVVDGQLLEAETNIQVLSFN